MEIRQRVLARHVLFMTLMVLTVGFLLNGGTSRAASSKPVLRGTVVWPPRTRPAPNFALRDQDHHLVTRASLRGHVALVAFMESHCTAACPVEGKDIALTQEKLGRHSPLTIVIISVAPGKDTVASIRAFAHKVRMSGNWHWLMGNAAQLSPVWKAWGTYVEPRKTDIIHTAAAYLVDQTGFVRVADEVPFRPEWLAGSVRALLLTGHQRKQRS